MAVREIKTRLAIDGEKTFKQALSDINSSLKVSASELKVLTAEYGKNDKGMKGLQATAKILSEQYAAQKEKVGALSGAVKDSQAIYDKANEKYKEMVEQFGAQSDEVQKAKEALDKAGKTVDNYTIQLNNAKAALINTENEFKNTEKAAKDLKNLKLSDLMPKEVAEKIEKVAEGFKKVATNAGKAAAQAAKIGAGTVKKSLELSTKALTAYTTAAQGAATAIAALTTSAASWADDLNTTAAQTHIATDELQKMQYAAELIDVDMETITGSIAKMVNKLDTTAGQEAFDQLGVSIKDANGEFRTSEDIFNDAIAALGKIENETERDALAMDLFGKSAQELNPLIDGGAEALKELGKQAEDTGLILSQDALSSLNGLNDSLDTIKANGAAAGRVISVQFAPKIKQLTDSIGKGLPSLAQKFGDMFTGATGAGKTFRAELGTLASDLTIKVKTMLPNLLSGFNNTLLGIVENIPKTVKEMLPAFIGGLKDLVGGVIDILPEQIPIIIDAGAELFGGLLDGLNETLDKLTPMLPGMIKQIGEKLTENAAPLLNSGVELLANIVEGIAQSVPELVKQAAALIPELVKGLTDNIDKVIQAGVDLIVALAESLPTAIPAILEAVPQIVDALIGAFGEVDWTTTSEKVFSGLGDGLCSVFEGALGIIDGMLGTSLRTWYRDCKDFFEDFGVGIYELTHQEDLANIDIFNEYGSLGNDLTRAYNEYIRNGENVAEAWRKAQKEVLTDNETKAIFNEYFAQDFTNEWLQRQAATVLANAADTGSKYVNELSENASKIAENVSNAQKNLTSSMESDVKEFEKSLSKESSSIKKSYDDRIDAEKNGLSDLKKQREEAYSESESSLKKYQDKKLEEVKRAQEDELDLFKKYQTEESAALKGQEDARLNTIEKSHNQQLAMYNKTYMEKLKIIDEERYNAVKAIQDEIDALNGKTEAEEEAIKKQKENDKLSSLQNAINSASSLEERQKAEKDLSDYRAELERSRILEERSEKIKTLEQELDNTKALYDDKAKKAEEEYNAAIEIENSEYELKKKDVEEYYDKLFDEAQKNLKRRQEDELDALKERNESELNNLKEANEKALEYIDTEHTQRIENLEAEKKQAIADIEEKNRIELEEFKKTYNEKQKFGNDLPEVNVTAIKSASTSYDTAALTSSNARVGGMPSTVPQKNISVTFNNNSPTEKTIYQQNRQNQQQLAIARQYAG